MAQPSSAPLLINERSGAVVLLRDDAGVLTRTEIAARGRWPAWAPGGERVSYSTVLAEGESWRTAIVTTPLAHADPRTLYAGPAGVAAQIAPNVPHYALWSPTSDALSYVSANDAGLTLALSTLDGPLREHTVARSMPIFHAWSPDGTEIAVHAGATLALFNRSTLTSVEVDSAASGFRCPQFTTAGDLLYATISGSAVDLVRREADGRRGSVATFDGGLAFAPAGDSAFVAVTHRSDASTFDALWSVPLDGSARELLWRGTFAAFWVAPTLDAVMLAVPTHAGDGSISLQARAIGGGFIGATEPFLPSDDLRVALAFFDQYALSHRPWAADGSRFAVAGRLIGDAAHGSFGDPVGDVVRTWAPGRGSPLVAIGPGTFASFPGA